MTGNIYATPYQFIMWSTDLWIQNLSEPAVYWENLCDTISIDYVTTRLVWIKNLSDPAFDWYNLCDTISMYYVTNRHMNPTFKWARSLLVKYKWHDFHLLCDYQTCMNPKLKWPKSLLAEFMWHNTHLLCDHQTYMNQKFKWPSNWLVKFMRHHIHLLCDQQTFMNPNFRWTSSLLGNFWDTIFIYYVTTRLVWIQMLSDPAVH